MLRGCVILSIVYVECLSICITKIYIMEKGILRWLWYLFSYSEFYDIIGIVYFVYILMLILLSNMSSFILTSYRYQTFWFLSFFYCNHMIHTNKCDVFCAENVHIKLSSIYLCWLGDIWEVIFIFGSCSLCVCVK